MRKIGIIGSGYIGNRIYKELGAELLNEHIYTLGDCYKFLDKYSIIINTAGYIGKNNVDECELNRQKTLSSNVFLPIILGEYCLRTGKKLIHIGSGCVYYFDEIKQSPITEIDEPDYYKLYYSRTKVYAEKVLKYIAKKANILILRIRIPLDYISHPKNILNKLIKYKSVIDAKNSVTYIPDMILAIKHLIINDKKGIYNLVNKGALYYPDLMNEYKKYNTNFEFTIMRTEDLLLDRTNLLMNTKKLEKTGFKIREIKDIIPECVRKYVSNEVL